MSIDTAPDGFYAVCPIWRAGISGFFWASWWTSTGLLGMPTPDAHGLAEDRRLAHERARAAILEAKGARASVLQLDAAIAVEAAHVVRPAAQGYRAGEPAWEEPQRRWGDSSQDPRASRQSAPPRRAWLAVLELTWPCSAVEVRRAYRRLARVRHPDRGGTDAAFDALTKAYEAALTEVEMASPR
jgi:hypothetical protein